MSFPLRDKRRWWLAMVAIALVGVGVVVFLMNRPAPITTPTSTEARQKYAALYQAAWRPDDGRSPTLITATLLVPPAVEALGLDVARSSAEEQLWRIIQPLDEASIPVVVTLDSVAGAITDSVIQNGLTLTAAGVTLSFDDWQPVISPTRVVNTSAAVTSQMGVALFRAAAPIDWNTIGTLKLQLTGIDGQPDRIFTWIEPKLLLQL